MSDRLIYAFIGDAPVHLDDEAKAEDQPQLLWKVVLRTGTWKLRPGAGGVKLKAPLRIFRDKAPQGHISMTELVKNFDAGAKEFVTVPSVHADGTTSDGGFVRRLVIQDVKGEDGSKTKESLLWAGMEITDSELQRKLSERSIRGVSGGILFDYERTEDAKKFSQILSHVMVTNSPWIGGTGDFQKSLPEGVMASEPDDLPTGEVEFTARETDYEDPPPNLPNVRLDAPSSGRPPEPGKASSKVVWKPETGLQYVSDRLSKALREWRANAMASIPSERRYELDWPFFSVSDVSLEGDTGTALITSGYGADRDTWVAAFKFDDDRDVEIDSFSKWTPAKQEWVAASEEQPAPKPPPARPAGRTSSPGGVSGLQEAQAARTERSELGGPSNTTGGRMTRISELLSRSDLQLSDEDREVLLAEERRLSGFEESEARRRDRERQSEVTAYCGDPADDKVEGKLDKIGLGDPGVKKYVRNALLSDDGGPAIELSEHLSDGQKTAGVPKTATELLKGFIDILPKRDDGRVALSEQARRVPDDPKPPEENDPKPADPKASADVLLSEPGMEEIAAMMAKGD
jgi:hypothetical protein